MAYRNLRAFLEVLKLEGELKVITAPVSCELEIAEITDRVSKGDAALNKALLFTSVRGYDLPILINAFGSHKRMCLALETKSIDDVAQRVRELLKPHIPESFGEKLAFVPKLIELGNYPPQVLHGQPPCQEVIVTDPGQPMLDRLPIIKCWPDDAGHFITLPVVITKDPDTGIRNLGMYRLQRYSNTTTGMHWHKHHDGANNFEHLKRMAESNGRLPVAVAIGCDPAITYAATAPLPPGIDELVFAGFLRQAPVKLARCLTVDLEVPAEAEIVLEGYVDQDELAQEGPFGDHTGFYSASDLFPVFHVTALTHRNNPIYQTTIVGKPPQEDCYLGKATERIFLPVIQTILPEVVDMVLPWEGVFHNCAIVSINKRYPAQARKVMSAIWGLGQMMFTKVVIVVDSHVNIHDLSALAFYVFSNVDPQRDLLFSEGPLDVLDHASSRPGYGSKVGIDATVKWAEEGYTRIWPAELAMPEPVKALVSQRWHEYGF